MKKLHFPKNLFKREFYCKSIAEKNFLLNHFEKINRTWKPIIFVLDKQSFIEKIKLVSKSISSLKELNNLEDPKLKETFFLDKKEIIEIFISALDSDFKLLESLLNLLINNRLLLENNVLHLHDDKEIDLFQKTNLSAKGVDFYEMLKDIDFSHINSFMKGIKSFSSEFFKTNGVGVPDNFDLESYSNLFDEIIEFNDERAVKESKNSLCHCKEPAVYKSGKKILCKKHFNEYLENKAFKTFDYIFSSLKSKKDYSEKNSKEGYNITIATSGGKDSLTLLYLTKKYIKQNSLPHKLKALCIDEGIQGYRAHTITDLKAFCNRFEIDLDLISFEEYYGISLDSATEKSKLLPCNICGIFRRQTLNIGSKNQNADLIATGHNLDDEIQSLFMNLVKNNNDQFLKIGPVTGFLINDKNMTQRIKPLYFITEKEVLTYTVLNGFQVSYNECPYAYVSFRARLRDIINSVNLNKDSLAVLLFLIFELIKKKDQKEFNTVNKCKICKEPTANEICKACEMKMKLNKSLDR